MVGLWFPWPLKMTVKSVWHTNLHTHTHTYVMQSWYLSVAHVSIIIFSISICDPFRIGIFIVYFIIAQNHQPSKRARKKEEKKTSKWIVPSFWRLHNNNDNSTNTLIQRFKCMSLYETEQQAPVHCILLIWITIILCV